MDKFLAYKTVLEDMKEKGPKYFQGIYDSKHGNADFMYGICTVMDWISYYARDEKFSDDFIENMVKERK